jgi:monoamine oxidase
MVVDVIVVGGGLSGMSAAYDVHKARKTVLVLEARDRVGGKTCSVDTVSGGRCDIGGAWFNEHTQHSITKLVREAKMPFVEQSAVGKAAFEFEEGNIQYYMDRELSVPVLYHSLISLRWFL